MDQLQIKEPGLDCPETITAVVDHLYSIFVPDCHAVFLAQFRDLSGSPALDDLLETKSLDPGVRDQSHNGQRVPAQSDEVLCRAEFFNAQRFSHGPAELLFERTGGGAVFRALFTVVRRRELSLGDLPGCRPGQIFHFYKK